MALRWYPFTALGIAGVGFIDATFLTIQHYTTFTLPCSIANGCELVTTSPYSFILGIPVALLGALYYVSVLLAVYGSLEFSKPQWLKWIAIATTTGFLFSAWFVYLQLFVIHAICEYCMLSALTSTSLFIVSMVYLRKTRGTIAAA